MEMDTKMIKNGSFCVNLAIKEYTRSNSGNFQGNPVHNHLWQYRSFGGYNPSEKILVKLEAQFQIYWQLGA